VAERSDANGWPAHNYDASRRDARRSGRETSRNNVIIRDPAPLPPVRLASRRDAVFRRLNPPVVFAALDHRLMAMILPGYEIKDA